MFPGPCSVVIINASIHKCVEFVAAVNARGGMVLFTPPYCWDCTPLDNGAYGLCRRFLEKQEYIDLMGYDTKRSLDYCFRHVLGPNAVTRAQSARMCFHNCGYF